MSDYTHITNFKKHEDIMVFLFEKQELFNTFKLKSLAGAGKNHRVARKILAKKYYEGQDTPCDSTVLAGA